jgi:hypothetical protein
MRLFATFFGGRLGQVFDAKDKAERYPGPRGFETAEKQVREYAPAEQLAQAVGLLRRASPEIFLGSHGNPELVAEINAFIAIQDRT